MTIEESDFRLTNGGYYWDLELMKVVRPKGKPERHEWGDPMYGMPLSRAIQIIINYRLNKKKDTYTLQEYLESYKNEIKLLFKTLKDYGIKEENC